jgi:hypothetical protein
MSARYPDDLPAVEPLFDFDRLAKTLATTVQRERDAAFVLGLHGPWGAGKTTLMLSIRAKLAKSAIIIDFNAWKYQNKEALWRALILRVLDAVRDNGGDNAKIDELQRSLYEGFSVTERGPLQVNWTAAATEAIQLTISLAAVGLGVGFLGGVAGTFSKWFRQKKEGDGKSEDIAKRVEHAASVLQRKSIQRAVQHVVSIEQFVTVFREIVAPLGAVRRIYVLIDDLDRCLPESALEIFEAVKLFLDAPECTYIVAVDRSVIRRGLELRYPLNFQAGARALPPVVDPDEYIEKTISLSVDLPLLADADGRTLLAMYGFDQPLSPLDKPLSPEKAQKEAATIINVLGTNPRRLKRFAAMLGLWFDVAAALRDEDDRKLMFSPLDPENRELFIKLSLIGYLNSAVLAQMQRDPGLSQRLQTECNQAFDQAGKLKPQAAVQIAKAMETELPVIAQAALDPALWRAFRQQPLLTTEPRLPAALRWFRGAAG